MELVWCFLITLLVGTIYLFNNADTIANNIIRKELIHKYNQSPSAQYIISIDDINLNIVNGSISLQDIVVLPKDSLIVLERNLDGKAFSSTSFELHISEISLTGFDIIDAVNNRVISAQKFKIENPHIEIYQHKGVPVEKEQQQDTVDLRSIFLHNYDIFSIGEITFNELSTSYHQIDSLNDTLKLFTISHLTYSMFGVLANRNTLYTPDYFNVDKYVLDSKNISVQLKNKASLDVKSIHFDSDSKDLEINDFTYDPNTEPDAYLHSLKYRKGWLSFKTDDITISDIDIRKWFTDQLLYAKLLVIKNPELRIHNNSTIPHHPTAVKPMLGEIIKSLPIQLKVEQSEILNATILMDITGNITPVHGKLAFQEMNIKASNLTNIPQEIEANNFLDIQARTRINQTGNINSNIKINLDSKSSVTQFTVHGSQIDLTKFNSVLKPIIRISMNDGKMIDLKINSTISSNGGFGTMDAHYTNLKVQLEGKDLNKSPTLLHNVVSGLANGLIKQENVPGSNYYHQGKFQFKKTKDDNFFKMLWLVTLNGLEDSVLGSDHKDEKKKRKKEEKSKKKLFNL